MKIAITSQNRQEITEHAGKCRKFWIYEISDNKIGEKTLLELPKEQSFHDSSPHDSHPLDDMQVLITGSMSIKLQQRLGNKGITAIVTSEKNPDKAVADYLAGTLEQLSPHHHSHSHEHPHEC
jgi:predicted Fe-Mo cluster-binding NifX family protein